MDENSRNLDAALEGLDQNKRSTLKRLIGTGAFVGPLVVSFAMADLSIDASFMHAVAANATTPPPGVTTTSPPATTTTAAPRHPAKS
jgi:hypothetical protein